MTGKRNFDAAAQTWDDEPRRVKLADEIAASIREKIPLSAEWCGADLGCGTGLITLRLAPFLKSVAGIDSSCGMLDTLAEKIKQGSYKNVRTLLCDVAAGEMPQELYHVITSAMTLHHIPEPAVLVAGLKLHVCPGGWVAFADLDAEDGSFHDDSTGVFHHGFSREEITGILENAGYSSISVTIVTAIQKGDRKYPVFLAVARN